MVAQVAIDGDHGDGLIHFQVGTVGQGDDAVNFILTGQQKAFFLYLGVVAGDHQQTPVSLLHQALGQFVYQDGKEGMVKRRHHQGHTVGLVGFQTPGIIVHLVSQLFDGGIHPPAVLLAHRNVVDYLGHCPQGDTGFSGNVFHGGGIRRFHSFAHPLR